MIRRLLILNGLAALGAVLYHATGWGYTAMFWWTDRYLPVTVPDFSQLGSLSYYGLRLIEQVIIFSIPAFIFVSGFFIAFATGKNQQTVSWNVIGVRIRNLLIPYLLWSFVIISINFLQGSEFSINNILRDIIFGKAATPYYFVPLIIQLYILAPFLVWIAQDHSRILVAIALLIQLTIQILKYLSLLGFELTTSEPWRTFTSSWFFAGHIFWFVLGIVLKFNLPKLKEWLERYKWVMVVGVAILIPIGVIEWELILRQSAREWIASQNTLIDELYSLFFLLSFLAFGNLKIPRQKEISNIGSKSYGIYLTHSPVLEYTSRGIYHLLPWLLGFQILFQPILIAMGLGVPLILMAVVNKSPARRYYHYLFG